MTDKKDNDFPIYDLEYVEGGINLYGISLVADPAIDVEFLQFSSQTDGVKDGNDIPVEVVDNIMTKGEVIDLSTWEEISSNRIDGEDDLDIKFAFIPNQTDGDSDQDTDFFKVRYQYSPQMTSSKSRDFCIKMANSGLFFKKEDLLFSNANPGLGPNGTNSYNLFLYKGGVNCQHYWTRKIFFNNKILSLKEALEKIGKLNISDVAKKGLLEINDSKVGQVANASNNYWRLSSEDMKFSKTSSEKRILTSPVLIPEQLIFRDFQGEKCYVKISAENIEKLQINFFQNNNQKNSTVEHDDNQQIEDIVFFESWTIADPLNDKANALGFKDLPKGTLMMSAKVSEKIWIDFVKTGKVKGFSIDSKLGVNKKNNKQKMNYSKVKALIMSKILLESELKEIIINDELTVKVGELALDQLVFDVNDVPMGDANFEYEGKKYTTDVDGVIVNIEEVVVAEEVKEVDAEVVVAEDLQPALDEANAKIVDLEVKVSDLQAELVKVKDEAIKLSKVAKVEEVKLNKEVELDFDKMTPLEKYRASKK